MRRRGSGRRASRQHPSMWKGADRPGVCKRHRRSGEPSLSLSFSFSLACLGSLSRHVFLPLLPSLSLSFCVCRPLPVCFSLSLSVVRSFVRSFVLPSFLPSFLSSFLPFFLSFFLFFYLSVCLSVWLAGWLSVCVSVSLCVSLSLSLSLRLGPMLPHLEAVHLGRAMFPISGTDVGSSCGYVCHIWHIWWVIWRASLFRLGA